MGGSRRGSLGGGGTHTGRGGGTVMLGLFLVLNTRIEIQILLSQFF